MKLRYKSLGAVDCPVHSRWVGNKYTWHSEIGPAAWGDGLGFAFYLGGIQIWAVLK